MSWSFSSTDTPAAVKAAFQQHIQDNPLQGHEKVIRGKLTDVLTEVGKGTGDGRQISVSMSGSAERVDGEEVSETLNISITPVA